MRRRDSRPRPAQAQPERQLIAAPARSRKMRLQILPAAPVCAEPYTCGCMLETVFNLWQRISSGAYHPLTIFFELLLIAISVNWCAGVLQGTRGTRLLRGLLIVLIVFTLMLQLVSVQTDWARLGLLYRYFLIGLALMALVAFQPELRRALMRAGDVPFLRRRVREDRVIAALVESAKYLSRNRYGAVIAVQRGVGLRSWAENGTLINAEVSANLLNTIFFPLSPLHDLGVIIEGDRILAASCQFPQAESGDTDASLGSRHRAAVGLSQESDALVLVVSEETGTISLADQGRLIRYLSMDDLAQELQSRLAGATGPASPALTRLPRSARDLRRLARRLSLVVPLSLVIWVLAEQSSLITGPEVQLRLNIAPAETLHVDVADEGRFQVRFRGPARAVDSLRDQAREQPLQVDWRLTPAYARPGSYAPSVAELLESAPALAGIGAEVFSVDPATIEFTVHETVTVSMPVRLESGVAVLRDVKISPQEVSVTLRRADYDAIAPAARVIEARLDAAPAPAAPALRIERSVPLLREIGQRTALRVQPETATVSYEVVAARERKRLTGVPVRTSWAVELQQQYRLLAVDVNDWIVDIEVEGDRDRVAQLQSGEAFLHVQVSLETIAAAASAGADPIAAPVRAELPAGIELVGSLPTIRFRIEKLPER